MTVFWSNAHLQSHVAICLMKFAVGGRNVAIRYIFCIWLCSINIAIIHCIVQSEHDAMYALARCRRRTQGDILACLLAYLLAYLHPDARVV